MSDVRQQLANLFQLTYPIGSDWELHVADPKKIPEFLAKFGSLSVDARYILAEIVMASFDLAAEDEELNFNDWDLFWSYLRTDLTLYNNILIYWAEVEKTGGWAIGGPLRAKLAQENIELAPWPW